MLVTIMHQMVYKKHARPVILLVKLARVAQILNAYPAIQHLIERFLRENVIASVDIMNIVIYLAYLVIIPAIHVQMVQLVLIVHSIKL